MNSIILKVVFCFLISVISTYFYLAFQKTRKAVRLVMFLLIFLSHGIVLLNVRENLEYLFDLVQIAGEFIILLIFSNEKFTKKLLRYVELNLAAGFGMLAGYMTLFAYYKYLGNRVYVNSGDIFALSEFNEQLVFYMTSLGITAVICYSIYLYREKEDFRNYGGRETTVCMCLGMLFILCSAGIMLIDGKNQWKSGAIYIVLSFMSVSMIALDKVNMNMCKKEKLKTREYVLKKQQETARRLNVRFANAENELEGTQRTMEDELSEIYKRLGRDGGILSRILENKVQKAAEKGITLLIINQVQEIYMTGEDQVSIVGNLLDNAIEAVLKPEVKDKTIKVYIKADAAGFEMTVENEFDGNLKREGDSLKTTKTGSGHGIGIEHVKQILRKYEKVLNIEIKESRFIATIKSIIIVLVFLGVLAGTEKVYADEDISKADFGDDVLYEYIVSENDGNGDGVLQLSEAQQIAVFIYYSDGSGDVIKDLSGLKYFTNLSAIDIRGEGVILEFTGWEVLNKMTKLTRVEINNANIADMQFLHNNPDIEELIITYNRTSLVDESLKCQISDVSGIKNCKKLWNLVLHGCPYITDISGLSSTTNLKELSLIGTSVADITPALSSADTLSTFALEGNQSLDSEKLLEISKCTNLTYFSLASTNAAYMPDLTGMTKLEYVNLWNNQFTDEAAIKNLPEQILRQDSWQAVLKEVESSKTAESVADDEENTEENTVEREDTIKVDNPDGNISVEGNYDEEVFLEAGKIDDQTPYKEFVERIEKFIEDEEYSMILYDIATYNIGDDSSVKIKVQPNGGAYVTIDIGDTDGKKYRVFRQEDDGRAVELETSTSGTLITFYTEHFSIFSVVITKLFSEDDAQNEENADNKGDILKEDVNADNNEDNKEDVKENKKEDGGMSSPTFSKIIVFAGVVLISVAGIAGYEVYRARKRKPA